jgi:hypothetical protein
MSWFSSHFKTPFSRRGMQSFFGSAGGLLPGVQEFMMTDEGNKIYEDIHKGIGNLVTGGYIGQREATKQQEEAMNDAKKRYAAEQAAAEETARKIAEAEDERKRRLAAAGNQMPSTLYGSYLGIPGRANSGNRPLLG